MNQPDPNSVVAAANSAKTLDPQSVIAASITATSTADAVGQATATAGAGASATMATNMAQMGQKQQSVAWSSMSQAQQIQLQSMGYNPPAAPSNTQTPVPMGSGVVHDAASWLSKTVGEVGHIAGDALNAVEAPLRAVQHLERAGHVLSEMGMAQSGESQQQIAAKAAGSGVSLDTNAFAEIFSPAGWSQAWRSTTNGEKTFDPAIKNQLEKNADPLKWRIATLMASVPQGHDTSAMENQIVASYPAANRVQITQMIASDPEVKNLTNQLQAAKMSVGREAVGQKFLFDHPTLGGKIAGGIDAGLDYAQDPTMQVGKMAKAADTAKWGFDAARAAAYHAGTATDMEATVRAFVDQPGAQRYLQKAAEAINSGSATQISSVDPKLLNVWKTIVEDHPDPLTPKSLGEWYSSQAGMKAILNGTAARSANGVPIFPHLSAIGAARSDVKAMMTKTINFMADVKFDPAKVGAALNDARLTSHDLSGGLQDHLATDGDLPGTVGQVATQTLSPPSVMKQGGYAASVVRGGVSKVGRVMRQMTTLTTSLPYLDLHDPESVVNLRKMLQYSLPSYAVDHITDLYAHTADLNQKFTIVKSGIDQMLHLAGVYSGPDGGAEGKKIMDSIISPEGEIDANGLFHGETYSPSGARTAVLDNQINHRVFLPDFHKVHAAALQNAFMHSVRVPVNMLAEKVMNLWRAGVLLRPGFPLRTSVDENLSAILRNGFGPVIAAHAVNRAVKSSLTESHNALRIEQGLDPEFHGLARAAHVLSDRVPPEIMDKVRTTRDYASAVIGHAAWGVASPFMHGLTRQELYDAAGTMHDHVWDAVSPQLSALAHSGGGYDEGQDLIKTMLDGKPTYMRFRTGKTYSGFGVGDTFAKQRWQVALSTMADSKFAQRALHDIDLPMPERVNNLLDVINSPDMANAKAAMKSSWELPDGRRVGEHGVSQGTADHAMADQVINMVDDMVREGDRGAPIRELVNVMRSGDRPSAEMIDGVTTLPNKMYGPDIIPVNSTDGLIQKGFTPLSRLMDNLARQPIFLHAYAKSYKELKPWVESLHGAETGMRVDGRVLNTVTEESAYKGIPEGQVRVFRGETPNRGPQSVGGRNGRDFTTSFEKAASYGQGGTVYAADIPKGAVKQWEGVGGGVDDTAIARMARDQAAGLHPREASLLSPSAVERGVVDPVRQKNIEELTSHLAADGAMRATKPYIHSPEIRSQFEVLHRTAMPFLFAQDQFLKRWVRTFVTNPEAIAKAQLGLNGLRTSGIVHQDAQGRDVFTYPGSQYVSDVLTRAMTAVGIPSYLQISVPFTGQLKMMMPGVNDPLTPSVGPMVSLPVKAITGRFPELQGIQQGVLGPGASNSYWEQIMPPTLTRVIHAVADNPDLPGQMSSSMMQAMQQLQSTGHGINPGSTTKQRQDYVDRLTNWARINLVWKAILGFNAPASPAGLFDPKNLNPRLQTLMNELPYNDALTEFLREHPDASAYTVFASKSVGGSVLPATKAAGDFLNKNISFAQTYQQAIGWLIPRTTGNQPFDPSVYREQIQIGTRDQKVPGLIAGQSQFLNDILIAPAAKQYYEAYSKEQQMLAGSKGNSTATAQIRSNYDQQKALFLAQNPAFAQHLTSNDSKAQREQTIWQLEQALTDPNRPKGSQTTHVTEMVTKFTEYQHQDLQLQGQPSSQASRIRTVLRDGFKNWADAYAQAHPDVSDLWTTLLSPEVLDTTVGLGTGQAAGQLIAQQNGSFTPLQPPPQVIGA